MPDASETPDHALRVTATSEPRSDGGGLVGEGDSTDPDRPLRSRALSTWASWATGTGRGPRGERKGGEGSGDGGPRDWADGRVAVGRTFGGPNFSDLTAGAAPRWNRRVAAVGWDREIGAASAGGGRARGNRGRWKAPRSASASDQIEARRGEAKRMGGS